MTKSVKNYGFIWRWNRLCVLIFPIDDRMGIEVLDWFLEWILGRCWLSLKLELNDGFRLPRFLVENLNGYCNLFPLVESFWVFGRLYVCFRRSWIWLWLMVGFLVMLVKVCWLRIGVRHWWKLDYDVYGILKVNCGLLMIIINLYVVCWRIDLILELLISRD